MASREKRLEKLTSSEYALLRELTFGAPLDGASLEAAIGNIVRDRLKMARGLLRAAKLLARHADPDVQGSAVSRAYYAAYQTARATVFAVRRHDYDDHEALPKQLDDLKGVAGTPGTELKELRLRRNEFDYSPYPGAKPGTPYPSKQRTSIIRDSVRRADKLIRALDKFLKEGK